MQIISHSDVSMTLDTALDPSCANILGALSSLSQRIDHVFNKINVSIQTESKRLNESNEKLVKCRQKIELLKGSKQPIAIFSASKFPSSKRIPFESLYDSMTQVCC